MRILIIGGTRFSGRALTERALGAGHEVTLMHRGRSGADLFPEAEHVLGDRELGTEALEGREFDAVVDMCGYVPRAVREAAERLGGAGRYLYISSISAYPDDMAPGTTEDSPTYEAPFPDTEDVTDATYGPLKVACERVVQDVFADRATIVRPGYIVGPHDPTDRFTWWVRRAAAGGRMLAPAPADYALQWIDARDLADFNLRLLTDDVGGVFNVVDRPVVSTMAALLATAATAGGVETDVAYADGSFLRAALGDDADRCLPLWSPELPGVHLVDPSRAIAAGLVCRPPRVTIADTLAWDRTRPQDVDLEAGLTVEREAELLAAWDARAG